MLRLACTSSLLLALSLPALAQDAPASPDDAVDLVDALEQVTRGSGLQVVVDPAVQERVSLGDGLRLPPREAVDALARLTRCDLVEMPGGILYLEQPPRLSFKYVETDVREVVSLIAAYAGKTILVTPGVRGRVTVDLEDAHWLHALEAVARMVGAVVVERTPELYLVCDRLPDPVPPTPPIALVGPRVDVDVVDTPLEDVLAGLSAQGGRSVTLDPKVQERITLRLRDVPWRAALEVVARFTRCRIHDQGGGLLLDQAPRNEFQAHGAPAAVCFQLLARRAGLNLIARDLEGTIDFDIVKLTALDALLALARAEGYAAELQGGAVRILPRLERTPAAPRDDRLSPLLRDIEHLARSGDVTALEPRLADLLAVVRGQQLVPARRQPAPPSPRVLARIDALLDQVLAQARARQIEELVATFSALKETIGPGGLPTIRAARERALARGPDLAGLTEVRLSLELQLDILEGNAHLSAMEGAFRRDDTAAVAEGFHAIEGLAERMRSSPRDEFRRNAEALVIRGRALDERAQAVARFLRLPLRVTAIALGPSDGSEAPDQAIVNGWIVTEGEPARDAAGAEIPGVQVVEVARSTVRFRFEDAEFIRCVDGP